MTVEGGDILVAVRGVLVVEGVLVGLGVEEQRIRDVAISLAALLGVVVGAGALPRDLIAEALRPEHSVEDQAEVVRGDRVAV